MGFQSNELAKVKGNPDNRQDSERGEQYFTPAAWEAHAKSHPIVLHKVQDSPASKKGDLLVQGHVGFDQNFQCLINQQDKQDKQDGLPCNRHGNMKGAYWRDFASMQSVA